MTSSVRDRLPLEVIWNRLIGLLDEAAAVLIRSSFSTIARESNDYACTLVDTEGNVVAQTNRGVPRLGILTSRTVRGLLKSFPPETLCPGDVLFTNDPWIAAGHLPDFFTVMPIFRDSKIVAYASAVSHVADVGGALAAADSRDVFEEGMCFPPTLLFRKGEPDAAVMAILAQNVRVPDQVIGDVNALIAANLSCQREVLALLDEMGLDDLKAVSEEMSTRSERAMRDRIREVPDGVYSATIETDGHGGDTNRLVCTLTVKDDEIHADYTGTSPQVARGINAVYNYTFGLTVYTLKCLLDPLTPNTEGSFKPFTVTAPKGSMLNCEFPAPVLARNQTGHFVPPLIMTALHDAMPNSVMAASGSPPHRTTFAGSAGNDGNPYAFLMFSSGGMGALSGLDGLSSTPFPSNAGAPSVEIAENSAPITVWRKALRPDSGGDGHWRGGLGVELVIENSADHTMAISTRMDRIEHPPEGLHGGGNGAPAAIWKDDHVWVPPKGRTELHSGERLYIHTAGGGGFGLPEEREPDALAHDISEGFVTEETATATYGLGGKA